MLHTFVDVIGAALFFICYGYAMTQEPLPRSDAGGPRGGPPRWALPATVTAVGRPIRRSLSERDAIPHPWRQAVAPLRIQRVLHR